MGAVVKFPDPMDELYRARKVRMEAPALDLSRALDRLQHSTDADDIARCRLIRRAMAKQAQAADHADAASQEQAREMAGVIYGADPRFPALKSQAEINAEVDAMFDGLARAMNRIVCTAALILGLAFVLGQVIRAVPL